MHAKIVRDPIHGNIMVDGVFVGLFDSPQMQRLRHIKQNGFCYLVYPSMNSTRFEHSLGVYYLGGMLAEHLSLCEKDRLLVRAASLLHDIGHAPFSHSFDGALAKYGFNHEQMTVKMILNSEITDMLSEHGLNPKDVADIVKGGGKLGKILSSEVDVDKMDYLVRDAHYAGVAYGTTDVERLIYTISLEKKDIILGESGLEAAESLLINRMMMHQTVYQHHTKRIAESMMSHAVEELLKNTKAEEIYAGDDISLTSMMRKTKGYVGEIMKSIDLRILFKKIHTEPVTNITAEGRVELIENPHGVEEKITKDLGLEKSHLLLDYPESTMSEYRIMVKTKKGLTPMNQISPLAAALQQSEQQKLTLNIYLHPKHTHKIKEIKLQNYISLEQTKIKDYT
jgi:uncharacterized protein